MQKSKKSVVSVGFVALGCAKNMVDAQVMAGYLKEDEVVFAPVPEEADVILVNTCAFIELAREEGAEAILSVCEHKQRGGCKAVVVAGCMVQRYREKMAAAFPEVDAFIGIDELARVAEVVRGVAAGKRLGVMVAPGAAYRTFTAPHPSLLFTGAPYAWLKVAEGCNHRCAYCAIPEIRGNFRSRSEAELLQEARELLRAGVGEINLISQDSLRFGMDRQETGAFVGLLRQLDGLEGDFWLRVLYGYPSEVSDELLEVMGEARHICHYLDLPIQHSHPEILRAMNRGKSVAAVEHLTQRLRRAVPDIVLRTTCLVGFPGESEAHFEHLLAYIKAAHFDHLGVFAFSPEEGTAAFEMAGEVDPEVADERVERLMEAQRAVVAEKLESVVGAEECALLLRKEGRRWVGRLVRQAPDVDGETVIKGVKRGAVAGEFVEVRVVGGRDYDLEAQAL